ncbi:transporter [Telmatospirillum siberiense]|uniref:Transporter n=1 Tax=Telmatospirillum siberiense TaxID=382514 RepID=A0A2N3PXR8_9PROT|nr:transporter [Telmatospirillum siberiense]PKU25187.1 transporter [Telmatospirillum siberiense]
MKQGRRFKSAFLSAVFGAVSLCWAGVAALAGSITESGETVGLGLGTPLPEGVYLVDTASYISRDNGVSAIVNIPVLAYSSPVKILSGTLWGYIAIPEAAVGLDKPAGSAYYASMYNPAGLVGLAWNLGNGLGFSNVVGGYAPMQGDVESKAGLGCNCWTFNERAALTYAANGYNLTVHAIYGTSGEDLKSHIQKQPDYLNVDLTATRTFGKWEVGPVAYGSSDLTSPNGAKEQSQFAMGGLVGYNFGPVSTQAYMTHDVTQSNYGGEDTRFYLRFVVPLWNPAK